ncbi:MAG: quinolinate synthase NadA [Desulfobacteraceae bacterium]|nr:quinolinate synthase NadA [Desulfobacteraceae bacterium]MBC2753965.1 quinolinate synthase NadA [Desulfobacteraceae bacterium]
MNPNIKQNIKNKIRQLAKEKNAIIIAHNYQPPEIQDIADLCGDSLELSIKASQTDADIIVFCGVKFMAETASILSPGKTILLPRLDAGCPMADMVTPEALKARIAENPSMPVVTYVNSTAAVKALTTICCTSANVVRVAGSIKENEMLMVPDRNLANYAATKTDKIIHTWDGYCPFHDALTPKQVIKQKQAHPDALFMAHPECRIEVLELADMIASTSGMINIAKESESTSFIVGTEVGLLYPLQKANPGKTFYPASTAMECVDMKKITLADVAGSLENLSGEVKVPEDIRVPALQSVKQMVEL